MDLIISYKSRFRLWIVWTFLVVCLFCSFAHSWRISQKCPHGHYYNDGCTACWCDVGTGQTKCEKLPMCGQRANHVKCKSGRRYKDSCGNDCTCYEATGTVLCNEKRKCSQDITENQQISPVPSTNNNNNVLLRRGGIAAPYIPQIEEHPIKFRLPGTTSSPPTWLPTSITTARNRNAMFYNNAVIESTPHPHVRIPSSGKSEELIIEPAIIIRKKGSNKASIVRNPSSATSVTLPSSRHRNHDHDHSIILSKTDNSKLASSYTSSSKPASLAPIHLYEKQLQTILNIRKAYSQLLRSKVNFNFQIATGKVPSYSNDSPSSSDHPRRFDSDYENSTIITNTTPSPPIFMTNQQPKPPPNLQVKPFQPLLWRNEIKNVLKQFSPVPPLKQLVSYVTTSTENYLRDFLNRNRLQQPVQMVQESSTLPTPPSEPPTVPTLTTERSQSPQYSYPFQSFSTIQPFYEQQFDPNTVPIHEVYQNHDFKMLATTSSPHLGSYPGHNSYLHKTLNTPNYDNIAFNPHEKESEREQFPFMNDLMREIARIDNSPSSTPKYIPELTALPTFSTPGPPYAPIDEVRPLSFLPPPQPEPATPTRRAYTKENEQFSPSLHHQQQHPTVRVNLDKPIYINPPPQPPQNPPPLQRFPPQPQQPHHLNIQQRFPPPPQQPQHLNIQQRFPPPPQQPQHHNIQQHYPTSVQQSQYRLNNHRFHHPPLHQMPPHQTNRRIYSITPRPHHFPPPLSQQNHQFFPPMQRHHVNPPHNIQHRPIFPQYFIPKPKQYRLVLKGNVRDAAVRVDDVVPRFVSKIAHEFFKKPEIYIPKIRPGKPLTLEKVVLNHKEIVPTEMSFSPTPGAPATKLRFTPQAQWEMKEDLARQGIMLNEPLTSPIRDYVANDQNVMLMDTPMKAVQTWETHSSMGMDTFAEHSIGEGRTAEVANTAPNNQAAATQLQQNLYNPTLLPSPTPSLMTLTPSTLDHQHQQELQHQLTLAQEQQRQQQNDASSSISSGVNDFKVDFADLNDFKYDGPGNQHAFPPELQFPGVEQVIVDKYLVQDSLGGLQMFSTTTIQPPVNNANNNVDISSLISQHHRNGLAALPAHGPTPPPSVLVRHHGAPTPTTTPSPLPTQAPSIFGASYPTENFLVTVINSTPQPFVTTTIAPVENLPSFQIGSPNTQTIVSQNDGNGGIASQIQDFLAEEMDFGARPQLNLYDLLFQHRTGEVAADTTGSQEKTVHTYGENIEATEKYEHNLEHSDDNEDQIATETKSSFEDTNVDTEKVANIFSLDYKNKYNKKPPAVIVIKVPPDHSDGPFPKVVEKRRGEEIEIQGGPIKQKSKSASSRDDVEASTEKSITTTTTQKTTSSESSSNDNDDSSSSKEDSSSEKLRREKKNRKRKRRRRKKKNRNRESKDERPIEDDERDSGNADDKEFNSGHSKNNSKKQDSKSGENKSVEINNKKSGTSTTPRSTNLNQAEVAAAEEKFQAELDWKSQLMANICDHNPSSPLCLTYRSICLLMTSED